MNTAILHSGIDLLSRREYSERELFAKLCAKSFCPDETQEVIQFLKENDHLSDLRFTESAFRSRINKGYGLLYIEQELKQKGVDSSIIWQVERDIQVNWLDIAQKAYQKKYGDKQYLNDKDKAKRIRFLQYRGFSSEEIFTIVNKD